MKKPTGKVWLLKGHINHEGFSLLGAWTDEDEAKKQFQDAIMMNDKAPSIYDRITLDSMSLNRPVATCRHPGQLPFLVAAEAEEHEPADYDFTNGPDTKAQGKSKGKKA